MSRLVDFLCNGEHPVEARPREKTREAMKECIARNYIQVKFTDTQGGTQLGLPIDRSRSDVSALENENGGGELRLVGDIWLDYVAVTLNVRIDVETLQGEGHLERRGDIPPPEPESSAAAMGG